MLYAVLPLGVAMMSPSACAVVMWLPSTKHSSWSMAGEAPLQGAGQGSAQGRAAWLAEAQSTGRGGW